MSAGFTFVGSVFDGKSAQLATQLLVAGSVCGVGVLGAKRLASAENPLIPDSKISLRSILDLMAGFIVALGDNTMGRENRRYLPFFMCLFCFIFSMNVLGLVPGFSSATDQFQLNLGIALCLFVLYNYWGIKELGFKGYLKHFCGPIVAIAPFLFVVELISHLVRPLSLSVRLYGNMTADHLLLGTFTDLTRIVIPLPFYFLGTLVCFLQAMVFTILGMIYVRFAVSHEH